MGPHISGSLEREGPQVTRKLGGVKSHHPDRLGEAGLHYPDRFGGMGPHHPGRLGGVGPFLSDGLPPLHPTIT